MSLIDRLRRTKAAPVTVFVNPDGPEAATQLEAMQAEIESRDKRLQAVRDCIERGYPTIGKTDKCPHDRFGFEDCVACYDEALLAALDSQGSAE